MSSATEVALDSSENHSLHPLLQTAVTKEMEAELKNIRSLTTEQLRECTSRLIETDRMPNLAFFETLSPSETKAALLACLLVWTLSGGEEVPREFQIRASLAAIETWNSEAVTQIWENHRKGGSAMFLWLEVSYVSDRAF